MRSNHETDSQQQHMVTNAVQDNGSYSIGEAAKMIGSTVKTVRYYDEIGLVKPTSYTEGGHRLYTTEDIWRLELTTTLRYLDFNIEQISQIISGEKSVPFALVEQIESLETQVSSLRNMLSILRQAKEHDGNSLHHIMNLVNTRAVNTKKRQQFITGKIEE